MQLTTSKNNTHLCESPVIAHIGHDSQAEELKGLAVVLDSLSVLQHKNTTTQSAHNSVVTCTHLCAAEGVTIATCSEAALDTCPLQSQRQTLWQRNYQVATSVPLSLNSDSHQCCDIAGHRWNKKG